MVEETELFMVRKFEVLRRGQAGAPRTIRRVPHCRRRRRERCYGAKPLRFLRFAASPLAEC